MYLCSNKKNDICRRFLNIWIHILFLFKRPRTNTCACNARSKESVFDLIMMDGALVEVRVREKKGAEPLPEKDKRTAEEFIRKYYKNIIDKWVKFFVLKQAIRSTNIKKKI